MRCYFCSRSHSYKQPALGMPKSFANAKSTWSQRRRGRACGRPGSTNSRQSRNESTWRLEYSSQSCSPCSTSPTGLRISSGMTKKNCEHVPHKHTFFKHLQLYIQYIYIRLCACEKNLIIINEEPFRSRNVSAKYGETISTETGGGKTNTVISLYKGKTDYITRVSVSLRSWTEFHTYVFELIFKKKEKILYNPIPSYIVD